MMDSPIHANKTSTRGDLLIEQFRSLNIWKKGRERAPHKPLLILLALGRLQQGYERLLQFKAVEKDLARLLVDFGPSRSAVHPEYPFWRLKHDGVWEVAAPYNLKLRRGSSDPLKSQLVARNVKAGFSKDVFLTLNKRPELVRALAWEMLRAHFPDSMHHEIAIAAGLDLDGVDRNRVRDTKFRQEVISAWGHRCGFCGYDGKLDNSDLGLEAAHIQWVQYGGPDTLANGISCCSLHHHALDRGAIGIDSRLKIIVSTRIHGGASLDQYFFRLNGRPLTLPSRNAAQPGQHFVLWHRTQVFRGAPRD